MISLVQEPRTVPVAPGREEQISTRIAYLIPRFGIYAWAPILQ